MTVGFAEEHGKQKAGIYYNIVKKAKSFNNQQTIKARLGQRRALEQRRNFGGRYRGFGGLKRNMQHRYRRGNMNRMNLQQEQ